MSLGRLVACLSRFSAPALLVWSCDASIPTAPSTEVVRLEIQHSEALYLPQGLSPFFSTYLSAWEVNGQGLYRDVTTQATWTSDNPNLFTMSTSSTSKRFEAGRTFGTARITATYGGHSATIPLVANGGTPIIPSLTLSVSASLSYHSTAYCWIRTASGESLVADQTTWSSADERIIRVSGRTIIGVTAGNTTLIATYGGLTATADVSVPPAYGYLPTTPPTQAPLIALFSRVPPIRRSF